MNKKKKNTRIKHRKNQERMKRLNKTSLHKAKPKKITNKPTTVEAVSESQIKSDVKTTAKKPPTKKTTTKKVSTKKTSTKKMTTKKTATKKMTTKKTATKKMTTKKTTTKKKGSSNTTAKNN